MLLAFLCKIPGVKGPHSSLRNGRSGSLTLPELPCSVGLPLPVSPTGRGRGRPLAQSGFGALPRNGCSLKESVPCGFLWPSSSRTRENRKTRENPDFRESAQRLTRPRIALAKLYLPAIGAAGEKTKLLGLYPRLERPKPFG